MPKVVVWQIFFQDLAQRRILWIDQHGWRFLLINNTRDKFFSFAVQTLYILHKSSPIFVANPKVFQQKKNFFVRVTICQQFKLEVMVLSMYY